MTDREDEQKGSPAPTASANGMQEPFGSMPLSHRISVPPEPSFDDFSNDPNSPSPSTQPRFAARVTEDLLAGSRALRRALLAAPTRFAGPNAALVRFDEREPAVILLRNGFAYRTCVLADGRRAILDVLVPGDVAGLDHAVLASPINEITAANGVTYTTLDPERLRALMTDRCVALSVMAQIAEARWRSDHQCAMIGRLDAEARIAALVLSIHDRLRQRGLTNHLSFNLPMTQEQIADHLGLTLVHVNRTLRRMREARLLLVDRQVVMIMDREGLRTLTRGLPEATPAGSGLLPIKTSPEPISVD